MACECKYRYRTIRLHTLSSMQNSRFIPEDLGLWGAEFLKDGYDLPRICWRSCVVPKGQTCFWRPLPDNAHDAIRRYPLLDPESCPDVDFLSCASGKKTAMLDQHLKNWIELCGHLQDHFNPGPNPEDFSDLDGIC